MRKMHQLFAVVAVTCAVSVVMPVNAVQGTITADRQTSATTAGVAHSDTIIVKNPNHERSLTKGAARPHQTAQLSRSAKSKAIRRAIAIRRARAAKAKKAASG